MLQFAELSAFSSCFLNLVIKSRPAWSACRYSDRFASNLQPHVQDGSNRSGLKRNCIQMGIGNCGMFFHNNLLSSPYHEFGMHGFISRILLGLIST